MLMAFKIIKLTMNYKKIESFLNFIIIIYF